MSTYSEERPGTGYYHPPGSSHGAPSHGTASPEQSGFHQGQLKAAALNSPYQQPETLQPPGSSHGFPSQAGSQPVTPVSGPLYTSQPPASAGQYYGLAGASGEIPSPPPTSRPNSQNFTPEGNPIVPVGISGGKMFRCRGFGDCDKVFTRSEHLARHVRKHTGERPFPCHCGKAFSRLDNLRQHSATVHADQQTANESMLASLAPVHAALSSRAGKEQRRRGEVVEVPKNAVERPRHNEGFQKGPRGSPSTSQMPEAPYAAYPPPPQPQWTGPVPVPPQSRPRTGGGYDYPYAPDGFPVPEEGGPSRRPGSSSSYQQPMFYPEQTRPPTADAQDGSVGQYGYRPVTGNERDLAPGNFPESDPPHSAHGPPQQHLYQAWQQHQHGHFPPEHGYPQNGEFPYTDQSPYGQPPPGSANYQYQPQQQYYPGHYAPPQPGQAGHGYPPPVPYQQPNAPGQDSPFQYHPPNSSYGYDNTLKRRADEGDDGSRKQGRPGTNGPGAPQADHDNADALWLPPTTERRPSLAISALLGSPQPTLKSPPTDQHPYIPVQGASYPPQPYPSAEAQAAAAMNGHGGHGNAAGDAKEGEMEVKAKALLAQHAH